MWFSLLLFTYHWQFQSLLSPPLVRIVINTSISVETDLKILWKLHYRPHVAPEFEDLKRKWLRIQSKTLRKTFPIFKGNINIRNVMKTVKKIQVIDLLLSLSSFSSLCVDSKLNRKLFSLKFPLLCFKSNNWRWHFLSVFCAMKGSQRRASTTKNVFYWKNCSICYKHIRIVINIIAIIEFFDLIEMKWIFNPQLGSSFNLQIKTFPVANLIASATHNSRW